MSLDEGQGEGWVGGVAAELGGDVGGAGGVQDSDGGVTEGGQQVRGRAFADAAGVLTERHVPHPMQPILNPPVVSRQSQQRFGVGMFARQRRDAVRRLRSCFSLERSRSREHKRLLQARPIAVVFQGRRGADGSPFETAMTFVGRDGPLLFLLGQAAVTRGKTPRR